MAENKRSSEIIIENYTNENHWKQWFFDTLTTFFKERIIEMGRGICQFGGIIPLPGREEGECSECLTVTAQKELAHWSISR